MTNKDLKMSGNKGEWSELYAFMKLLSQGRVYAANEKVEKIEDVYYPILKIMREETRGEIIDYIIGDNQINVEMHSNRILSIDRKEMGNQADRLLSEIATHSGSFELEDVAKFANGIKVTKIKAPLLIQPIFLCKLKIYIQTILEMLAFRLNQRLVMHLHY